ncbi:hypothetical protein M5D96_010775, partial [Drosophila gunungcola]
SSEGGILERSQLCGLSSSFCSRSSAVLFGPTKISGLLEGKNEY